MSLTFESWHFNQTCQFNFYGCATSQGTSQTKKYLSKLSNPVAEAWICNEYEQWRCFELEDEKFALMSEWASISIRQEPDTQLEFLGVFESLEDVNKCLEAYL